MHVPINVKSPNNISKWQMGFNSAFKGLRKIFVGKFRRKLNHVFTHYRGTSKPVKKKYIRFIF
jgi:hypothetical protein